MDISVLAAVGSFVVSEQVLKPKATLLIILGCVLAYDLKTKTRDPSSLRVYRGPALLAFTLIMVAYSLRTWRRNGVACDELLFLPGTQHAEETTTTSRSVSGEHDDNQEGDAAAGFTRSPLARNNSAPSLLAQASGAVAVGSLNQPTGAQTNQSNTIVSHNNNNPKVSRRARGSSNDGDDDENNSLSSIREFADTWDEDDDDDDDEQQDHDDVRSERIALVPSTDGGSHAASPPSSRLQSRIAAASNPLALSLAHSMPRPSEYRITRLGAFFFFRNASSSTSNATYAPSGPSVVGAALDLCMPILFNFHLFIEAFNHMGDSTPAKILPLIFLSVLIVRAFFPVGRRARFWSTIKFVFMAPFSKSLFRDLFLGDVLTSLVRPGQDVLFALSYYVTVIAGTVSGQYGLNTSGRILESSWILHNVILPSCALLPLWFKFLQTLREAYDHGKRWPYLGNAFKYLTAACVIMYGMVHSENRRGPVWIASFAFCVLYQIWWDVVVDWELLVLVPKEDGLDNASSASSSTSGYCATISSVNPNNRLLLLCQQYYFQPICEMVSRVCRFVCRRIPSLKQIKLRPKRLYKSDSFYWGILAYNIVFRLTWMLCFIPAYHLSPSGRHHITTFSSDTNSYVGVLLPVAEILRRTFWGFLYLEVKTIRMDEQDANKQLATDTPESFHDNPRRPYTITEKLTIYQRLECDKEMRRKMFTAELCLWAAAFVGLAMWATN
ncbi:hypothetical protein MPSEU_000219100 [Mayamaea pseudoterrestris]|nr:hypothetical protein MPSEU_000219100 [Mayamaea pseudoterrestris]